MEYGMKHVNTRDGGADARNSLLGRVRRAAAAGMAALAVVAGVAVVAPTTAQAAVSSDKQQVITIDPASLNGNAIRGKTDTNSNTAMDNWAYFYSSSLKSSGAFPDSGKITASTSNITYQLGWTGTNAYDGNDCVRLVNGDATKTVELSTYGAYEQIYVLATAGGTNGTYADFQVTLTYTDGTTATTEYKLYDWYDTATVKNVEKIGSYCRKVITSSGSSAYEGSTNGAPYLHSAAIDADKTKLLKSITFKMNGKSGSGSNEGIYSTIYAITGVVDKSAPAAPVATPATNVSSSAFTANWNSVSGATSYVIDVATDEGFSNIVSSYNNQNVGNVTSANVTVPNIGNQTYYYRVRAVNANGQSLSSNVITVSVPASLKVQKVVNAASGVELPTKYYLKDGTEVSGFSFKFTLPTSTSGYAAQVYNADGTTAGDTFRVTNGYIQTIKPGQYILVYGLSAGDNVTVEELTQDETRAPYGFNLTSRTKGSTEQQGTGNAISATIVAQAGGVAEQNQLTFTNTYQPTSYTIADGSFTARKTYENGTWDNDTRFTIRIKAAAGTPMPAGATTDTDGYLVITKDFTKLNKDSLLTCGEITYTTPGTYVYMLNEAIPDTRAAGVTYSGAEYRATITVSDDGKGSLYVSDVKFVKNLNDDGTSAGGKAVSPETHDGRQVYVGDFTNRYDNAQASVIAEVGKNYTDNATGASLTVGQFSFKMEAAGTLASETEKFSVAGITADSSIPMPESVNGTSVTVQNLANGVATFPAITYTYAAGNYDAAYVYKITEVNEGTVGVTYDSSEYYMVVRCHKQNSGITVTREYYKADGTQLGARPDFVNTYDVEPVTATDSETDDPLLVSGSKVLENRSWNEGESYTFDITPDDVTAAAITAGTVTNVARTATATSDDDGTFTASPAGDAGAMTFTKPGTYTFKVTERSNNDTATSGINYDSHTGTVVYTVTDTHKAAASGKSQLAVSVAYNDMTFTNTYAAKGTYAGVKVTNTLTGRAIDETNVGKFTFSVQGVTLDGNSPSIAVPTSVNVPYGASGEKTVITAGDANASLFAASTDQSMIGKKQAFLIRLTSGAADGYSFDTTNAGSALVVVEVKAKESMPSDLYTVTTIYKGADVDDLNLGALTSDDLASLTAVQTVDSSATSDQPEVDFTSTYGATLDYGAQSNLQIHTTLKYADDSAVTDRTHSFELIVKPVATETVTAEEAGKHLTSSPSGKVISTGALLPATGEGNTYTHNLAGFKFGAFTQDDAGKTFAFDTSEVVETAGVDGYTFDTNTYRTFIAVSDNGDGTLTATTRVFKMNGDEVGDEVGTAYTCSTNERAENPTTSTSFTNTYKAYPPASYTPQVKKAVVGKDASESDVFEFTMVPETSEDGTTATEQAIADGFITYDDADNTPISTTLTAKTSGAITDGAEQVVSFDKIVFHKVGTYVFNVTEKVPNSASTTAGEDAESVEGWNYDTHTYTLTITVRDSGGQLTASAAGSSENGGSVFSNTYQSTTTLGREGGIDIKKTLTGRTQREGEFSFKAEGTDDASKAKINAIKAEGEDKDGTFTVTNDAPTADGYSLTDIIEGLSFSNADKNENGTFNTFTYKVSEVAGSSKGMTYDTNYYLVAITPYMDASNAMRLKVSVQKYDKGGTKQGDAVEYDSADGQSAIMLDFANTYKASGSWGGSGDEHADDLNANVTLTGRDLKAGELAFTIKALKTDYSSSITVGSGTNAAANDGEAAKITLENNLSLNLGEGMGQNKLDLLKAVELGYAEKVMKEDGTATYTLTFQMSEDTTKMPAGVRSVSGDPTRTLRLVVTDDGQGNLTAQVEYRTGETTGSVDFYDVYEKVKTVSLASDATGTDLDGQPLSAGSEYTYSIKWVNDAVETDDQGNRTSVAATVTVTDTLPANVEFVSADNGGVYDSSTGTVTWTLADQAARSYGTVKVTVRATSASTSDALVLSNTANVSVAGGSTYDSNTTSNPVARKTSSAGQGTTSEVGDEITYTIEYANATADAAPVTITDALPNTLEFVEASNGGTYANGTVTWTLNNVAAGASGSVTVKARVLASAVNSTIANSATVQVGDGTPIQTTTASNPVSSGSLKISKTVRAEGGVTAPSASFKFKITLKDKDGNELPASEQYATTGSKALMVFNGCEFTLASDEYLLVSGLPVGYQYSVEEIDVPEHFNIEGDETKAGAIADGTTSEASFVNVYTPDAASLSGADYLKVAKVLTGRDWQDADRFTFSIEAANDAAKGHVPGGDVVLSKGVTTGNFTNVSNYSAVGTYEYYVTEKAASTTDAANLTSSQAKYLITVTVADKDSKLSVTSVTTTKVRDDAGNEVNEAVENHVCTFTNSYATAQPLTVSNTVTAEEGFSPSADKEFTYTVELKYADGTNVTGEFGGLTFVDGKATFTLKNGESKELSGLPNNATYTVTQKAEEAYVTTVNGEGTNVATGTVTADAATSAEFGNYYGTAKQGDTEGKVKPTDPVAISCTTTITGRSFTAKDNSFTYVLQNADGSSTLESKVASVTAGTNSCAVGFSSISYDKPGTYTYTIRDAMADATTDGVYHDASTHTLTVTVTDNGEGKLQASAVYDKTDESEGTTTVPNFTLTYSASSVSVTPSGSVDVTPSTGNSFDVAKGQFNFTIHNTEKPSACTTEYADQTVANDDEAKFTFGTLEFPVAGTYKFTVTENTTGTQPAGTTPDGTSYEVVYVVKDNGGGNLVIEGTTITATKGGESSTKDSITFNKTYEPTSAGTGVSGSVTLENTDPGTTREIADGEFSYTITNKSKPDGVEAPMPAEGTVSNTGTAFSFGDMTYTAAGTYVYEVKQNKGADSTVTYDDTVYTVTVTVTDEGGKLSASTSISAGEQAKDAIAFGNKFTPAPVKGNAISGSDTMTGRDFDENDGLTVTVKDPNGTETPLELGEDGTFSGGEPTFTQTGTYTYTVWQPAGERGGVTYDNSVYSVTYKVTEDENHELVVEREITKTKGEEEPETVDEITFENTYEASGTPTVDLSANVTLDGGTLGEGDFTIEVLDKDGNVVATGKNDADGTVGLGGIELPAEPGTYTYTIKQQVSDKDGVTTDEKTYTVTVVVTDNLNGGYDVTFTYEGLPEGEVPTFSNTYTAPKGDDGDGDGDADGSDQGGKVMPQTGDTNSMTPVIAAAVAGVALIVAAIVLMKRKK